MEMTGAKAYLVNTGWNGTGKRISIRDTRGIIDAILDGSIDKAPTKVIPFFDFVVPTELPGVDPKILDPRDTYECACQWEEKKTWLDVSSRTSLSSQETKLVKLLLLLVQSCNLMLQYKTESCLRDGTAFFVISVMISINPRFKPLFYSLSE